MSSRRRARVERGLLFLGVAVCLALVSFVARSGASGSAADSVERSAARPADAFVRGRAVERGNALPTIDRIAPALSAPGRRPSLADGRGSSATSADIRCELRGRITLRSGGVRARLRFDDGANEGVELETTPSGEFQRAGLAPGLQLVTVQVPEHPACTRSVLLRPGAGARLDLDLGAPVLVSGRIRSASGERVAGARVTLDGIDGTTDPDGGFTLPREASGAAELIVRAAGYAWFSCAVDDLASEPLDVRLEPACSLEVAIPGSPADGDALVRLQPRGVERTTGRPRRPATPWHRIGPVRCAAGNAVRFDNLPACEVDVQVAGARGGSTWESAVLEPGRLVVLQPRIVTSSSSRTGLPRSRPR